MMHNYIGGAKTLLNIRKEIYNALWCGGSLPDIFSPIIAPS